MNTLFKSSQRILNQSFRSSLQKSFSTGGINAVVGVDSNNVQTGPRSEVVSRLMLRDIDYFTSLSQVKGTEYVLRELESATSNLDASRKYGREVLRAKDEILVRLSYQNRTIEDHQNVSTHICENDLTRVYEEHLKTLSEKTQNVQHLVGKSNTSSQLLYEYRNTAVNRYLVSPFLWAAVPAGLVSYYKVCIASLLGTYAPHALILASLYSGLRRHQWLTRGERLVKGSQLVTSLTLNGENLEVVSYPSNARHTLSVASTSVVRVENDARTEVYYLLKNSENVTKFILPVDQNATVNQKFLDLFNVLKNSNDAYNIQNILLQGDRKLIDSQRHRSLRSEIDNMARINILTSRGQDVTTLNSADLAERLYSIPDSEVADYLNNVRQGISSNSSSLETQLVSVENIFASFGISREEATALTHYLRDNYKITNLNNLNTLSRDELSQAYYKTVKSNEVTFDALRTNLEAFFKTK